MENKCAGKYGDHAPFQYQSDFWYSGPFLLVSRKLDFPEKFVWFSQAGVYFVLNFIIQWQIRKMGDKWGKASLFLFLLFYKCLKENNKLYWIMLLK